MKKDYLVQILQDNEAFLRKLKEGDIIEFEMPSFCSGDYSAEVFKDESGLYINRANNFFSGCRDFDIQKH